MPSIDDRVVNMKFENAKFAEKAASTMSVLDKLREKLEFKGAEAGLKNITAAQDKVNFASMSSGIDNIVGKLSIMGAAGFTVIQSLTNEFLGFAKKVAGTVLDPLVAGGKQRAINIEQAKFLFRGLGIDVEAAMASANEAVLGTAYSLDVAAKAAAQLGGSGLKAGADMTKALRGIAGIAGMTNSSFEQIADVFVSAAGKGKVSGYEFQRIGQQGLNVAAKMAEQMGTTEAAVRKMAENGEISFKQFYEAMDEAFGEHATKANETFTGSLANMRAALSRVGASFFGPALEQARNLFNALSPVIKKVHEIIKPLINSLTIITGLISNYLIKKIENIDFGSFKYFEEILWRLYDVWMTLRRAWLDVFPSKTSDRVAGLVEGFTRLMRVLIPSGDALVKLGGIFKDVFRLVHGVYHLIRQAWIDMFPEVGSINLNGLIDGIAKLVKVLMPSEVSMLRIMNIFKGVFAVISIGWAVIKTLVKTFIELFDVFGKGMGIGELLITMLETVAKVFIWLDKVLVKEGGVASFFQMLLPKLQALIGVVKQFGGVVLDAFGGVKGIFDFAKDSVVDFISKFDNLISSVANIAPVKALVDTVGSLSDKFKSITGMASGDGISGAFGALTDASESIDGTTIGKTVGLLGNKAGAIGASVGFPMRTIPDAKQQLEGVGENVGKEVAKQAAALEQLNLMEKAIKKMGEAWNWVGDKVIEFFNYLKKAGSDAMGDNGLQKVFGIAAIAGIIYGIKKFIDYLRDGGPFADILESVGGVIDGFTGHLEALTKQVQARSILTIAIAVAVLTASMLVMSKIDGDKLGQVMGGFILSIGSLLGTMALLKKMKLKDDEADDIYKVATAMIALGVAILILAFAAKIFSTMEWEELAKAGVAIGVLLRMLTVSIQGMPKEGDMAKAASSIIALGVAVLILAAAVFIFGKMDMVELAKGVGAVAVLLVFLGVAMKLMPDNMAKTAGSIIALGIALLMLSASVSILGNMEWDSLRNGMVAVFLLLAMVVGTMHALPKDMETKAVGLLVVAAALAVMAAAIYVLGSMDVLSMIAGLGALVIILLIVVIALQSLANPMALTAAQAIIIVAGALLIMSAALAVLAGIGIGGILVALGGLVALFIVLGIFAAIIAFTPIGPALLVLATVMYALGISLALIGVSVFLVGAGIMLLVTALQMLFNLFEDNEGSVGETLGRIFDVVQQLLSKFIDWLINEIRDFIRELPTIISELGMVFNAIMDVIIAGLPRVFEAINLFLDGLIATIHQQVPALINALFEIINTLLTGLQENIGQMTSTLATALVNMLNALTAHMPAIAEAGANLIVALFQGIQENAPMVVSAFVNLIVAVLTLMAQAMDLIVTAGAALLVALFQGIQDNAQTVIDAFRNMIVGILYALALATLNIVDAGRDLVVAMIVGIQNASTDVVTAFGNMIEAVIRGLIVLIHDLEEVGVDFVEALLGAIAGAANQLFDAGVDMFEAILSGIADNAIELMDVGLRILLGFLNALEAAIETYAPQIQEAAGGVVGAIFDAMVNAIAGGGGAVLGAVENFGGAMLGAFAERLGIASPSKEFYKLMQYAVAGVVDGINDNDEAISSVNALGNNMLQAFQESTTGIASELEGMGEFSPRITPVLDLTSVKSGAGEIGKMVGVSPITAGVSLDSARSISELDNARLSATVESEPITKEVNFNQTIIAPKPLRTGDIYRQTKSQIALAKERIG